MMKVSHEPGFLHVKDWAVRWFREEGWPHDRLQVVFFFTRGGKANFNLGHSMAEAWMKDLNQTEREGDDFHYFVHHAEQPGFAMSRSTSTAFRKALYQVLELGPKGTPFKGFSSEALQTSVGNLVQAESKQATRWV